MTDIIWYYSKKELLKNIDIDKDFSHVYVSRDVHQKGTKKFSAILIKKLRELLKTNHHIYEILLGRVKPYFDLDFEIENNISIDTKAFIEEFLLFLISTFQKVFGILLQRQEIVLLNASTSTKISFHIIINNKTYFENAKANKYFTDYLSNIIMNSEDESLNKFRWTKDLKNGNKENRSVVDTAPYSCFQNFRCVNQSKKGKTNVLLPEDPNISIKDTLVGLYENSTTNEFKKLDIENLQQLLENNIDKKKQKREPKTKKKETYKNSNNDIDHEFDTEGKRLMDNVNEKDFAKLPLTLKYLYTIPIQNNYRVWLAIGMALKKCGYPQEHWEKWSRLGSKYRIGECDTYNDFRESGVAYNERSIRRWAKICTPEYFANNDELMKDYLNINEANNVDKTVIDTKYILSEHLQEKDRKIIVIKAHMGKGKTVAIKNFIKQKIYNKILFICPRQAFSYEISNQFSLANYLDIYEKDYDRCDRLAIQLESLHKLNRTNFDIVVLDESESILKQFSSKTMRGKHLLTFNKLEAIVNNSKQIIFADAFITDRTMKFAKSFEPVIGYIENISLPVKREAIQIHVEDFVEMIINSLRKKEKIYVACGTMKMVKEIEYTIKSVRQKEVSLFNLLDNEMIFYHSDTSDSIDNTLKDVVSNWKTKKLVCTSPKITVGISFDVPDYFDKVFVFGYSSSTVRDQHQTIMRVRHIKTNTVYFTLMDKKSQAMKRMSLEKTFYQKDDYDRNQEKKYKYLRNVMEKTDDYNIIEKIQILLCDKTPKVFSDILFWNDLEANTSQYCFNDMFVAFFEMMNYNVTLLSESENPEKISKRVNVFKPEIDYEKDYNQIQNINYEKAEEIKRKIQQKRSTSTEKLEYEKYLFKKLIKCSSPVKGRIFFIIFKTTSLKVIFNILWNEKNMSINNALKDDLDDSWKVIEMNEMKGLQLKYIREIIEKLGIRHSQDTQTLIKRETIISMVEWMMENRCEINTVFKMKDHCSNTGYNNGYEKTVKLIQKVLRRWCMSDLKPLNHKNKMTLEYTIQISNPTLALVYENLK